MRAALFIVGWLLAPSLSAHEGHDHGEAPKPPPVADAAPRFEAASEEFELVGILQGRALTLYLDDFASNAPVQKAVLELEAGTQKAQAREIEPGTYRLELADAKPGRHSLVFSLQVGEASDLLTANLDIPATKLPVAAPSFDWRHLGWVGVPLLGFGLWRRRVSGRREHG
jgi:hypothetical protein